MLSWQVTTNIEITIEQARMPGRKDVEPTRLSTLIEKRASNLRVACQRGESTKASTHWPDRILNPRSDYATMPPPTRFDEALRRLETRLLALTRTAPSRHGARARGTGFWPGSQSSGNLQNLPLMQAMIEIALRVTGTYGRGRANAGKAASKAQHCALKICQVLSMASPSWHPSDLHADTGGPAMQWSAELAHGLDHHPPCRRDYWDAPTAIAGPASRRVALC